MKFTFQLSRYEEQTKAQLLHALETLAEIKSRNEQPAMWQMIDKLNAVPKVSQKTSEKRRKRYRLYGVILLGLGLFATLPSLMAPKELLPVLVVGIISLVLGALSLVQPKINSIKSLQKEAERIWSAYQIFDNSKQAIVEFQDTGVYENGILLGAFPDLLHVIFEHDIILLVWKQKFLFLQQQDLQNDNMDTFLSFLKSHLDIEVFIETSSHRNGE